MGTLLRVLSESFIMSTNMTGLSGFQKSLHPCTFDKSSLSIGRVNVGDTAAQLVCCLDILIEI